MITGNLTLTPDGNMVVAEGIGRARWERRTDGSWKLVGIWPDDDERAVIRQRLHDGAGLLIVLDPVPGIPHAFRDELCDPGPLAAAAPDGPVIDVAVPFLDWLPEPYAERARLFQVQIREQTADLPAALQPALLLEDLLGPGERVRFAVRAPRSVQAAVSAEQICSVADYAFNTIIARIDVDSERPGSTSWFARLAATLATGSSEPVASASGGGRGL